MKKNFLLVSFCLFVVGAFGHEQIVHQAITINAAASALNESPAVAGFVDMVSAEIRLEDATNSMGQGSVHEDDLRTQDPIGGFRSLNHFYDPLTGFGLSDIPLDFQLKTPGGQIIQVGRDSFTWASTRNCPGIDIYVEGIGLNANTHNVWSWKNARDYEWHGLTDPDRSSRQAALSEMFRGVGQVVHLLEDTTSPQHVRNEQHLLGSPIEKYGADPTDVRII